MKKVEELHPQMTAEEKENQADGEEETVIDIDAKPEITFDDFGKMQFQVGEIISCEAVPKSKKLLCSQVKIGSQVKQMVSGNPQTLYTRRNGWQESYGTCELEAGKTWQEYFQKECFCAQKMQKEISDDTGKSNAGREQRFANIQSLKILCTMKHIKRDRLTIAVRSGKGSLNNAIFGDGVF